MGALSQSRVERSLDDSIKDGAAYSVGMGLGETYVRAGAVFLKASDSMVGLLGTVPVFLGTCMQLLAPGLLDRGTPRKRIVVPGAVLQALSWLPMIAALWTPPPWNGALLFGGFVLYYATFHLTIPAWISWMGDLVPAEARGRYFSRRNAGCVAVQLVATGVGGWGLWVFQHGGREREGFALVFGASLAARLLSSYWLARQWEPGPAAHRAGEPFSLIQFYRRLPTSNFARFALFVGCMNASAHFAGSVFDVYLLRSLRFTIAEYSLVMAVLVLMQVPSALFWGRIIDRGGARAVLVLNSVGIALIPLLWMVHTSVAWGCVVQCVAGFSWAGFNLAVGTFLLDAVTVPQRARCAAYLNLTTNAGVLLGGIGGATFIPFAPDRVGPLTLPYAYWSMLGISFLLRLLTMVVFLPRFREVRPVPHSPLVDMLFAARPPEKTVTDTGAGRFEEDPTRRGSGRVP